VLPYSKPTAGATELAALKRVICSGWLTTGPAVVEFEKAFAQKVGAKFAVAFSSGTSALIGACSIADLSVKSRAVTSTLSFIASANCARYFGSQVDLVDVDPKTLNMTAKTVQAKLTSATRAVIAVHYAGLAVDLAAMRRVCRDNGTLLIEDAAHALGTTYKGSTIGDCRYSDLCCFSFHPTKLITTGEGGMVTTNSADYAERLRVFRNHGITRPATLQPWEYDCATVSFNFRLSDLHSAMGLAQLTQADAFLAQRRAIAEEYRRRFSGCDAIVVPAERADDIHAYHIYVARFDFSKLTIGRRELFDALVACNIRPQVHYRPIHRHGAYRLSRNKASMFPVAEAAYESMLSLPMYPQMTLRDARTVADAVLEIIDTHRRK
jgi:dTDP-4-amino-4,6-dideoxygalactose transaminase